MSYYPIPLHPAYCILLHPIPSHPILSHSYLILSHPIPSHPIHPILSHHVPTYAILLHPVYPIQSYANQCHPSQSYSILSHRIHSILPILSVLPCQPIIHVFNFLPGWTSYFMVESKSLNQWHKPAILIHPVCWQPGHRISVLSGGLVRGELWPRLSSCSEFYGHW